MNSNNRHGNGYRADLASNMAAYDQLPRALRQALATADHNWSARQCLTELRRPKAKRRAQFTNVETAVRFIREQDDLIHRRHASEGLVCLDPTR